MQRSAKEALTVEALGVNFSISFCLKNSIISLLVNSVPLSLNIRWGSISILCKIFSNAGTMSFDFLVRTGSAKTRLLKTSIETSA
ncbi:unnamed protein product [Meloidogyne enterolobii]|uniref:Uncharacterized protein n=1 Tax=Meloidogyne enterolobii TaxID=390850 RepID=A0ACB0YG36_MELEN